MSEPRLTTRTPPVMTQPDRLAVGDRWIHKCPHGCVPDIGIQGGRVGLVAHLATVHPGETTTSRRG